MATLMSFSSHEPIPVVASGVTLAKKPEPPKSVWWHVVHFRTVERPSIRAIARACAAASSGSTGSGEPPAPPSPVCPASPALLEPPALEPPVWVEPPAAPVFPPLAPTPDGCVRPPSPVSSGSSGTPPVAASPASLLLSLPAFPVSPPLCPLPPLPAAAGVPDSSLDEQPTPTKQAAAAADRERHNNKVLELRCVRDITRFLMIGFGTIAV